MSQQKKRRRKGTQQTRVRAWAGSVKGQVHDKSRTREPFGERCGQMSDTWFGERDFRWADVGHCIPQTYVAEDGQNGFGLFMDDISIVRAASTTTGECDVEGPRRPTRARGPSLLSVNLTIRKTMRWCKKDDQGGQLDEEEATTTGGEPRGTPLARHEQTCGHCKHFT